MNGGGGGGGGQGMNGEHIFHFGGNGLGSSGGIPDELLHMLFGLGLAGSGGAGGAGGGVGVGGFGPHVAFHNGMMGPRPMHGNGNGPRIIVQVKPPEPIIKTVSISLEQSYMGCSLPLDIDRQMPNNDIVHIERETIHIQIPKGIHQGDTIILNDCGNMNDAGIRGDIRILINILQHQTFKVDGLDLYIDKTISLKESLCGFQFEIHHLSGKIFQLSNKAGNIIKNGSIKTIPNIGLEKNGEIGSIKIKFQIEFPESLTVEQIRVLSNTL